MGPGQRARSCRQCTAVWEGLDTVSQVRNVDELTPPEELRSSFDRVVNLARPGEYDGHPDMLYIGRTQKGWADSGYANPVRMEGNTAKARLRSIIGYWDHLQQTPEFEDRLDELRGRPLGCWCAPRICHGHILAAVVDGHSAIVEQWVAQLRDREAGLAWRLLVTGSRKWRDRQEISEALQRRWQDWGRPRNAVLVVGDAPGADTIAAEEWAKARLPVERHVAHWDEIGRGAGAVRNNEMVASGADRAEAFWLDESPGTGHCISVARKAGIPINVHRGP